MRLALLACFATTLVAATPYRVTADIEYAKPGGESLKLDAHIPEGKGPFPAIILVSRRRVDGGTQDGQLRTGIVSRAG